MRVLWFSNTPANADEILNKELAGTGGWLKSLDEKLQNYVELFIVFYGSNNGPFKHLNSTYYPIKNKESIINKVLGKIFNCHLKVNLLSEYLKIIESVRPDIIHIHGTESTFGDIIGNTDIPVVVSIQGNITIYRHKYFSGVEKKYIKHFIDGTNILKSLLFVNNFKLSYKLFTIHSKKEQIYLSKCNNIIGRTDWDRRISRILAPNSTYFHCDEILRGPFYTHKWKPTKNTKFIIHTTTSGTIYKGLETICFALNLLNRIGFDVEWQIAGIKSDEHLVKLIKAKLKKDYPTKGLIYLGSLNAEKLVIKMLEANIYVMPSHIENSPNSLCEAMILGMPCIATFAGGTSSILKENEEGILVQDGDPWSMAGAIVELLQDSNKMTLYGQNARKKALLKHNKENIVSDLINIYNEVTKDTKHSY